MWQYFNCELQWRQVDKRKNEEVVLCQLELNISHSRSDKHEIFYNQSPVISGLLGNRTHCSSLSGFYLGVCGGWRILTWSEDKTVISRRWRSVTVLGFGSNWLISHFSPHTHIHTGLHCCDGDNYSYFQLCQSTLEVDNNAPALSCLYSGGGVCHARCHPSR